MNYWTFKHTYPGAGFDDTKELVEWAILLNSAIMQYEYGYQNERDGAMVTQNWNNIQKVHEGDYIFLRGRDKIYAVGIVVKPRALKDKTLPAETLSIKEILDKRSHGKFISGKYKGYIYFHESDVFYEDLSDGKKGNWGQRIDVDNWKYDIQDGIDCQSQENFEEGQSEFGVLKVLKENKARKFFEQLKDNFMRNEVELLKNNKNLILTGAPGTGKTFLAKEIAVKLLFEKSSEKLLSKEEKETLKKRCHFVQFHPSYDYTDFVEGLRPTKPDKEGNIGFELKDGVFKQFCKTALYDCKYKDELKSEFDEENSQKYVFIIDEINRGEISKIFGELFFSIEPGYRGKKGAVKTQYANIQTEPFDKDLEPGYFYIPENVYIIGTMNDIDRSIESIDFAMRRRFAWKEIKAEDSQIMFEGENWKDEAIKRMNSLNNAIWSVEKKGGNEKEEKGIPGLNSSYHIGAAYFKTNLPKYEENERFEKLWEYHLQPLLFEYLRGMANAQENLIKLRDAFFKNNG